MWCKRVGGNRGQIRTYDKRKGQRESNLIWSKSRTEAKRGKKGAVQETVPVGKRREVKTEMQFRGVGELRGNLLHV